MEVTDNFSTANVSNSFVNKNICKFGFLQSEHTNFFVVRKSSSTKIYWRNFFKMVFEKVGKYFEPSKVTRRLYSPVYLVLLLFHQL
mgnify:CR=1 FL=1